MCTEHDAAVAGQVEGNGVHQQGQRLEDVYPVTSRFDEEVPQTKKKLPQKTLGIPNQQLSRKH